VLFTFYMISDPGTTPSRPRDQVWFGAAVAAAYGVLQVLHVVFGLFFALAAVCLLRGALAWAREALAMAAARRARLVSTGTGELAEASLLERQA